MAKTQRTDVRADAVDGKLYLWRITESDVEGEGGQERVGVVSRMAAYEQLTRAQQQVDAAQLQVDTLTRERDFWRTVAAQVEATEPATAQAASSAK
jgi:hypothetical protein